MLPCSMIQPECAVHQSHYLPNQPHPRHPMPAMHADNNSYPSKLQMTSVERSVRMLPTGMDRCALQQARLLRGPSARCTWAMPAPCLLYACSHAPSAAAAPAPRRAAAAAPPLPPAVTAAGAARPLVSCVASQPAKLGMGDSVT